MDSSSQTVNDDDNNLSRNVNCQSCDLNEVVINSLQSEVKQLKETIKILTHQVSVLYSTVGLSTQPLSSVNNVGHGEGSKSGASSVLPAGQSQSNREPLQQADSLVGSIESGRSFSSVVATPLSNMSSQVREEEEERTRRRSAERRPRERARRGGPRRGD